VTVDNGLDLLIPELHSDFVVTKGKQLFPNYTTELVARQPCSYMISAIDGRGLVSLLLLPFPCQKLDNVIRARQELVAVAPDDVCRVCLRDLV
jgi:hypothetical protein